MRPLPSPRARVEQGQQAWSSRVGEVFASRRHPLSLVRRRETQRVNTCARFGAPALGSHRRAAGHVSAALEKHCADARSRCGARPDARLALRVPIANRRAAVLRNSTCVHAELYSQTCSSEENSPMALRAALREVEVRRRALEASHTHSLEALGFTPSSEVRGAAAATRDPSLDARALAGRAVHCRHRVSLCDHPCVR